MEDDFWFRPGFKGDSREDAMVWIVSPRSLSRVGGGGGFRRCFGGGGGGGFFFFGSGSGAGTGAVTTETIGSGLVIWTIGHPSMTSGRGVLGAEDDALREGDDGSRDWVLFELGRMRMAGNDLGPDTPESEMLEGERGSAMRVLGC